MDTLFEKQRNLLKATPVKFKRSLAQKINWDQKLIGIRGARGTGKTTMLLQYIKTNCPDDESVLYVSLDNLWFAKHELSDLIDDFVKQGGKNIFLDEVHKYKNWSEEIKNMYDDYPHLRIIFTGSSLLQLKNAPADLSRRVTGYRIQGLSFREFIEYETARSFPVFSLKEILEDHKRISGLVKDKITHPVGMFRKYLRKGYYPFYKDSEELYYDRINDIISYIIDVELPVHRKVHPAKCHTVKKLLYLISESAPFNPNIDELERQTKADKNTVIHYINILSEADLLKKHYYNPDTVSPLKKPDMLQLENTNISWALPFLKPKREGLWLTFLANQLAYENKISVNRDFEIITGKYLISINRDKESGTSAIPDGDHKTYQAVEDIEHGHGNVIPLWLFGFLY